MINIKKFDEIKKVMGGRVIQCDSCGTTIKLILPEQSETPGLYCDKGCTDIALDFTL